MDKKMMIGGAVLAGAGFWFYVKPNYIDSKPPPVYTEAEIAAAPRPTLTLPERVLNLKSTTASPNYVKAVIALEFHDEKQAYIGVKGHALELKNEHFADEMKPDLHKIQDAITFVFGTKTIDQVSTSEGKEQLKQELIAAINRELHHEQVERVFFSTFITQ